MTVAKYLGLLAAVALTSACRSEPAPPASSESPAPAAAPASRRRAVDRACSLSSRRTAQP